jgi:tetratricopeptide (TPR) repeat protein
VPGAPRSRARERLTAAGLVALTLVVFAPALDGGVLWDDDTFVLENRLVRAADGLYAFWFTSRPTDYFPLTSTLLWIQWRLWDGAPAGYYAVNIAFHAASAVAIWRVLRRLAAPGAAVAAALFAVHPVTVASVAWISEQKNTLSLLLFALALLAWLRFEDERRARWYGVALGAFLCALLAKTSVVMMPVVMLLLVWYRRGRVGAADLRRAAPFFALAIALGLVTVHFQHAGAVDMRPESLPSRLAAAGWCVWFYLYKTVAPVGLSMIYPRWDVPADTLRAWMPLAGLCAAAAVAWRHRAGWGRPIMLALGYTVAMLAPVLGLVGMSYHQHSLVADHLQYVALVGPIALAVAAGAALPWRRPAAPALAAVALIALVGLASQRIAVYTNARAVWLDTLAKNPAAWAAHGNLGRILDAGGAHEEAETHYTAAIRLRPDDAIAHNNLGASLARRGRHGEAEVLYRRALALRPAYAEARSNLGNALSELGRLDEGLVELTAALAIDPEYAEVHNNLGIALAAQGRHEEAVGHYRRAIALKPGLLEPQHNLGNALLLAGRVDEAVAQYEIALRVAPESAATHRALGEALGRLGLHEAAARHFEAAGRR